MTITRHIKNPGIVTAIYSGIFRDIQQYSAMFIHIEGHQSILRHIQVLLTHREPLSDIFGTLPNFCMYNRAIFRTLSYLEPKTSSKACRTCKTIMYIQSPGIVRTVYTSIFKGTQTCSGILMHIQPHLQAHNQRGEWTFSLLFFVLILEITVLVVSSILFLKIRLSKCPSSTTFPPCLKNFLIEYLAALMH